MKQDVFITGIGIIASTGATAAEFWKSCLQGKSEIARVPAHWSAYRNAQSTLYAPLPLPDFSLYPVSRAEQSQLDKSALLAMVASFQALNDAGLKYDQKDAKKNTFVLDGADSARSGVMIGTGISGISSLLDNNANHLLSSHSQTLSALGSEIKKRGNIADIESRLETISGLLKFPSRFNPFVVSMSMPNGAASTLGIKFSLRGQNQTFCSACASGTSAVGHAFRAVAGGSADLVLCGGTEYLMDEAGGVFRGFDAAGTLALRCENPAASCRPFDAARSGFLFSEGGAAILVLESGTHARARGARAYAEVSAFSETFDAHSIMMMEPGGIAIRAMTQNLLAEAGLTPPDVDYINTHGTGTVQNDEIEATVISDIFGKGPLLNSTKSMIGHALGASGAIEAAVTALSLYHGAVHPSLNIENPVRDLNFARTAQQGPLRNAITHSFAFGGHNAGLVLKKAG